MHLILVRHGESIDDLTDQYGGWADFPLTPRGYKQIEKTAQHIYNLAKKYKLKFEKVITSPLIRAVESGRIIANLLSIPQEISIYLKEKNGYGLLSGLNKSFARGRYPDLVKDLKKGYVFGAEPHEKFSERVKVAYKELTERATNRIAVTHGGFLKEFFREILKKKLERIGDGGFVLLKIKKDTIAILHKHKFYFRKYQYVNS